MTPRVLVVDDDPQVLKLLRLNFEMEGYDVDAAPDGAAALAAAAQRRPDAVVCDVMMPGMDGLEVVRRLRADPELSDVAIVVVSAKAQRSDMRDGVAAGADEYVTKPFDPQEVLDAVARLLEGAGSGS